MAKSKDTSAELDALIDSITDPNDLGQVVKMLRKRVLERALEAEMTEHLGYEKHDLDGYNGENSRNGKSKKTVLMDTGAVEIDVPRDRDGTFQPQLVKKNQRRLKGFDDQLISLYARGMTVRDIQGHIQDMYDVDVSPDTISRVTDGVLEEVRAWQNRQLDPTFPIVYFDGFVVKARSEGAVRNRTVYVVLGINMQGHKEVLGMWMAHNEGAKFWLHVMNELRSRGLQDILISCVDGLRGFPEAIEATFPHSIVQTCLVHMVRNSTRMAAYANRKKLAASLKKVYSAATEEEALVQLDAFEKEWGNKYPSVVRNWRDNWHRISPFFEFSPIIRKAIYTTNPIEALNRQLRKVTKTRGVFPNDAAVFKLLWLAVDIASRKWKMPIRQWDLAIQQLAIHFGERCPIDEYRGGYEDIKKPL